jgi:hypothetical protein
MALLHHKSVRTIDRIGFTFTKDNKSDFNFFDRSHSTEYLAYFTSLVGRYDDIDLDGQNCRVRARLLALTDPSTPEVRVSQRLEFIWGICWNLPNIVFL